MRLLGWAAGVGVLWVLDVVVWRFTRSRGAGLSGDEPHYLVLARMLSHGSLHPLAFYRQDIADHALFAWPANLLANPAGWHAYRGPHGLVSIHGLGLPLLLAPFVAAAGRSGGIAGLMALEAVGWVYLFVRVTGLAQLRRPARVVAAVSMAGPAVWIASAQVYPDFIAGLLIAIAITEIARVEVQGRLDAAGIAAVAVSAGMLPWLHIKNVAPGALVLAALAVVAWRTGLARRAAIGVVPAIVSWLLLLGYDLWGFGRPLGVPQPGPRPSWAAITHGLGLLVDRHQGLVVQVPTIVLALVGLCMARRAAPFAVAATGASVLVLLYLNGSYVGVPYGGTALAGRFSWSDMAPLLLWLPFLLARIRTTTRVWTLGGTVALIWIVEAIPILAGRHVYYNAQISGPPWDPSQYPGWWGPLDRVLPELAPKGPLWGTPSYALLVALLAALGIGVAGFAISGRSLHEGAPSSWPTILARAFPAVVAVAVAVLAAGARPPLPAGPVVLTGQDVGSPVITGAQPAAGATVPLRGVGAGTFTITVDYHLTGAADLSGYCTTGTPASPGPPTSPATATLDAGDGTATLTLRCPSGIIWFRSGAEAGTRLDIATLTLRKTSS